jgi:hypothetical protein
MLFKILNWNPRLYRHADVPSPSITIDGKHNLSYVLITGTDSDYDNKIYSCTPFLNNRDQTVLLLNVCWDGYPLNLGHCTESKPLPVSDATPTPVEYMPPKDANQVRYYNTYEAYNEK